MRFTFALAALAALFSSASAASLVLTDASFESSVGSGDLYFVKFYAPWCGHCKRLAPTWDTLATELAGTPNVHIAKVDCTVERDACASQGVRGYPTLQLYKGGSGSVPTPIKYSGARELAALKDFVAQHTA